MPREYFPAKEKVFIFSFQNLQVQLYYVLQEHVQRICCKCCYSFTWSGDLTVKVNLNFPKARIQPCHHIKKRMTSKTELQIQSLLKSQCHEYIPEWHSLSMIKYTIINKPKRAEIFSCLGTTGTPTMPEPTSPHILSLSNSSLQHIPLSRLVSILTWATAQWRCRSRTQDWEGSFFWELPHPPAPTHPLSTTAHVCWMKISSPRAVYSTEHNPHPLPGQLCHQDIVMIRPTHYYIQRSLPVAYFQGYVFLIFLPNTFH